MTDQLPNTNIETNTDNLPPAGEITSGKVLDGGVVGPTPPTSSVVDHKPDDSKREKTNNELDFSHSTKSGTITNNIFNDVVLYENFFYSLTSMYSSATNYGMYKSAFESNAVKYVLHDSKLLSMFHLLDTKLINGDITSESFEPIIQQRYYLKDKQTSPTFFTHDSEEPDDEKNFLPEIKIVEANTFLNNRVLYNLRQYRDQNYTRIGQYDTAISIFNVERTGWDATTARLKKNAYEMYKMDCMKIGYMSTFKNVNFIRETIGRMVVNKNSRVNLLKPRKSHKFSFVDGDQTDTYEVQFKKYKETYPLGFKEEQISAKDINIGNLTGEVGKDYATKLSKIRVYIYGYDSIGVQQISDNEVYVSRASTIEEFYFEFKCLVGYCMCVPDYTYIHMINPLLSDQIINQCLISAYVKNVTYTGTALPLFHTYQHLLSEGHCIEIVHSINTVSSEDMLCVLKAFSLAKFRIELSEGVYMNLLDYTYDIITKKHIKCYKKEKAVKLILNDSYHVIRCLEVLDLIQRTNDVRIPIPPKFIQIRYYMREFSRLVAINADYIVQRLVGSFANQFNFESMMTTQLCTMAKLCIFSVIGGNVLLDMSGKPTNVWVKNSLIWDDSYLINPTVSTSSYSKSSEVSQNLDNATLPVPKMNIRVGRRLDWLSMERYVDVGDWQFGDIYTGIDFESNKRDLIMKNEMPYYKLRNTCIRYHMMNDKCTKVYRRIGDLYAYSDVELKGAMSIHSIGYSNRKSFYYFCEIPSILLFAIGDNVIIHNAYYRGELPTYNISWVNSGIYASNFYTNYGERYSPSGELLWGKGG